MVFFLLTVVSPQFHIKLFSNLILHCFVQRGSYNILHDQTTLHHTIQHCLPVMAWRVQVSHKHTVPIRCMKVSSVKVIFYTLFMYTILDVLSEAEMRK